MWGKKQNMKFSNDHTLISRGTTIKGDVHFAGELQIEGTVQGNVIADDQSAARIVVAEKGQVVGEIRVPSVVINGAVEGDIFAAKHIELAAKAVVDGNVHYQLIEMVKGAQVNGNLVFLGGKGSRLAADAEKPDSDDGALLETVTS